MPKISVIIPTYNRADLIGRAIDSVLAQTFTDYEIVVIDDGSTDNTKDALIPYNGKIKYVFQENGGIAAARNRGLRESAGEYIAFLDSDDYWAPDKLAQQVEILDAYPKVGIVFAPMPIVNEHGETVGRKPAGPTGKNLKELLEFWGDLPTSTVMTRRACFEKAGVFDPELPPMEDFDMWLRISRYYDLYEIEGKTLAYYYRHSAQATSSKLKVYEGLVKIYTKAFKDFPEAPRRLMIKRIASNRYTLSRVYFDEGRCREAFTHALGALGRDPLVGLTFAGEKEGWPVKMIKVLKTYAYLIVCGVRCLRRAGRHPKVTDKTAIKAVFVHEHPDNIVGQEKSLIERLYGLTKCGVACEVLLPGKGRFYEDLKQRGFTVRLYWLGHLRKCNPFPYIWTVWEVFHLIKVHKYSVVHCSGAYPSQYCLPAARLSGTPCVAHINTTVYTREFLKKCFVQYVDCILAVSEGARQNVLQALPEAQNRIQTVYDSIGYDQAPEESVTSGRLRENYGLEETDKIIGQIGSVIPLKGYEYFVRMASIVKKARPEAKFFIVGPLDNKEYVQEIKEKIVELELDEDVILTGYQKNVLDFLDMFDVTVLASNAEGLGRVIIESQKMGTPVVCTDIPGCNEAVENDCTGILVPLRDPEAMAEAVLNLLDDKELYHRIASEGEKAVIEKFDGRRHARIIFELYQDLLGL